MVWFCTVRVIAPEGTAVPCSLHTRTVNTTRSPLVDGFNDWVMLMAGSILVTAGVVTVAGAESPDAPEPFVARTVYLYVVCAVSRVSEYEVAPTVATSAGPAVPLLRHTWRAMAPVAPVQPPAPGVALVAVAVTAGGGAGTVVTGTVADGAEVPFLVTAVTA